MRGRAPKAHENRLINEVGESDRQDFIVMEYVDGQSLKDRLTQAPLPLQEALQKATEVANGTP